MSARLRASFLGKASYICTYQFSEGRHCTSRTRRVSHSAKARSSLYQTSGGQGTGHPELLVYTWMVAQTQVSSRAEHN
ncbi:unnamed protein product [Dovyalis caffra]|uniref:Uncharacterized protein n=1 Tax=Dovyalis caffra TaxID=77055 RepID=A0AAV1SI47_9ROSI|nr:unnamed protein product [Dovyalis caffra]